MSKKTFAIKTDSSGREYVYQQIDEYDKNNRDAATSDATLGDGRMYARVDDPLCPVYSFKLYLGKLHPDITDLWQRPKDTFDYNYETWYCKSPVGKKKKKMLAQMMPEISIKAKLSQRYANHSVRATSISAMDNAGVEARHIMRASGNRSESSIRSYSKRLSENKQREISDSLNSALQTEPTKDLNTPSVFGLSAAEIEAVLSDSETVFEEIPTNTSIATCTNQNDICVTGVQNKENLHVPAPASKDVHLLMNNVQPW
jgi:hypothetical protein